MPAKLYVIVGSHACRTSMLLLDHKHIDYDVVEIPAGLHPVALRVLGFKGNAGQFRHLDDRRGRMVGMLDRLGTVPSLKMNGDRVKTNRAIARHLDTIQPGPPLFPADQAARRQVEEAEAWGDDVLQMAARRIVAGAGRQGLDVLHNRAADGRIGPLLFRSDQLRTVGSRAVRMTFGADPKAEASLRARLPEMLDRVDGWIDAGVLDGEQLNAADYMIVTSLALLGYVNELRPELERRPLIALVDRVLPEPD